MVDTIESINNLSIIKPKGAFYFEKKRNYRSGYLWRMCQITGHIRREESNLTQ